MRKLRAHFDIRIIGVPKTIDNDISSTDRCPGFASAARFGGQSTIDLAMDIRSLPQFVPIFETLGRDVGWLAASATLAGLSYSTPAFEIQLYLVAHGTLLHQI